MSTNIPVSISTPLSTLKNFSQPPPIISTTSSSVNIRSIAIPSTSKEDPSTTKTFALSTNAQNVPTKPVRQVKPFNSSMDFSGDRDYRGSSSRPQTPQTPHPSIPLNMANTNIFPDQSTRLQNIGSGNSRLSSSSGIMHRMDIPPPIVTKPPPPIPLKNIIGSAPILDLRTQQRLRPSLVGMPPTKGPSIKTTCDISKKISHDSTNSFLRINNDTNVIIIPDPDLILNFGMSVFFFK